jgi:transcriptional regulator with XRE-family HTH domain
MEFGERNLKIWRLKHGLSKRTPWRKMLGVSVPTLIRWEEGLAEPRDYNLQRILNLLEEKVPPLFPLSRS